MDLMKMLALVACFAFSTGYAVADDKDGKKGKKEKKERKGGDRFTKADANNDGEVSKEEFIKASKHTEKAATNQFEKVDKNADGKLTKEEYAGLAALHGKKEGEKPEEKKDEKTEEKKE